MNEEHQAEHDSIDWTLAGVLPQIETESLVPTLQPVEIIEEHDEGQQDKANSSNGNAPPPFLIKTYDMVNDPNTDEVVRWSGDTSFVVCDQTKFALTLLPCYFKHNNLSSFIRQLNIYGFRKVAGSGSLEFSNPSFLRGSPARLSEIKRRRAQPREEKGAEEAVQKTQLHEPGPDQYLANQVHHLLNARYVILQNRI